jgi:two-component system, response regulator PdtaR
VILTDEKLARLLEPSLQRVLVVEPHGASARLLGELLKGVGAREIHVAQTGVQALGSCKLFEPQVILTEIGPDQDGLKFVRSLRRSTLPCREAPVIVVTAEATASTIVAARNAGVHEFLRKPFAARDLNRRLEAAVLRSRDWVEAVGYVGPDRRRFNSAAYEGPRKRRADQAPATPAARLDQALKIARSAIAALESDPAQALRSLQVQASELKALAAALPDAKLAAAASKLQTALSGASVEKGLSRPTIETAATDLWPFLAPEPARAVA